jgi:hypothetical protein
MNKHQVSKIVLTPDTVDCIVFWTKNPENFVSHLDLLNNIKYYFQFTVTAYVVGDCENRAAHSHNRHHELSLGFGRSQYDFGQLWGFNKRYRGL